MKRAVTISVLIVACCAVQQGSLEAVAQQSSPAVEAEGPGAATTETGKAESTRSPALTGVRFPLYRLQKDDVVEIDFSFSPEFNQSVTVQPDGYITLKAAQAVHAEGKTIPEFEAAIRGAYNGMLHDPEVSVTLKEFDKPYFIAAGEVTRPGKYELHSENTVSEAIAIAGGFTPRAKHSQVVLFRRVSGDLVESHVLDVKAMLRSRNLAEDMQLQPGDLLWVPQNLVSKLRQFLPASGLSWYLNPAQF